MTMATGCGSSLPGSPAPIINGTRARPAASAIISTGVMRSSDPRTIEHTHSGVMREHAQEGYDAPHSPHDVGAASGTQVHGAHSYNHLFIIDAHHATWPAPGAMQNVRAAD